MISQEDIKKVIEKYDQRNITIAVLGGHSGLDVCRGAKKLGFRTLAICKKGRDKTYSKYFASRKRDYDSIGCVDEVILVDEFSEIIKKEIQEKLRSKNVIFIHNRYFWVYCNYKDIENKFLVPIFGTRQLVRLEERDEPKNQYYLLEKAKIRTPKIFKNPKDIDRLVIVKASEAERGYERAFFFASDFDSYQKKSKELMDARIITPAGLKKAVIEEYVIGAQVNFNYFYSVIDEELEIMGTDTRRQTNIDGYLRLPADIQLEVLKHAQPKIIETGHLACTTKESIIEKMFEIGEQFVDTLKKEKHCAPGIIGPFALQGSVVADKGREDIVIFDVSMRIPGSPGTIFTPHTGYLYSESISYGDRIAREIRRAIKTEKLDKICT